MKPAALTLAKLQNGMVVLAHAENSPKTYVGRPQAERALAKLPNPEQFEVYAPASSRCVYVRFIGGSRSEEEARRNGDASRRVREGADGVLQAADLLGHDSPAGARLMVLWVELCNTAESLEKASRFEAPANAACSVCDAAGARAVTGVVRLCEFHDAIWKHAGRASGFTIGAWATIERQNRATGWWGRTAQNHVEAAKATEKPWTCDCAACRAARASGWGLL